MARARRTLVRGAAAWALVVLPGLAQAGLAAAGAATAGPATDLASEPAPGESAPAGVAVAHELHVVTADLAIEGSVMAGRLRFFKHELEQALGPMVGADMVTLTPGAESDALVLRYLRDHLRIEAGGVVLEPVILQSGEDELDRHPTWWVVVQYQAPAPIRDLTVRNTLLFEMFEDQRNVMKLVRFPEASQETVYFEAGEEEHTLRLR